MEWLQANPIQYRETANVTPARTFSEVLGPLLSEHAILSLAPSLNPTAAYPLGSILLSSPLSLIILRSFNLHLLSPTSSGEIQNHLICKSISPTENNYKK
jgi:hypothetical protein